MDAITLRFIAIVITVVWAISSLALITAAILAPSFSPPLEAQAVQVIMGVLAGGLFGKDIINRAKGGDQNGH